MKYKEFVSMVHQDLSNDPYFQEEDIRVIETDNDDKSLAAYKEGIGLINGSPKLHTRQMFRDYRKDPESYKRILLAAVIETRSFYAGLMEFLFSDRSVLDKRVFFIPVRDNLELLEYCPYIIKHGVKIVFAVQYKKNVDIIISRDMAEYFKYTQIELWNLALENTPKLYPAKLMDSNDMSWYQGMPRIVVITNTSEGGYGAGAIFYRDIGRLLAKAFPDKEGVYIFLMGESCCLVSPFDAGSFKLETDEEDEPSKTGFHVVLYYDLRADKLMVAENADLHGKGK